MTDSMVSGVLMPTLPELRVPGLLAGSCWVCGKPVKGYTWDREWPGAPTYRTSLRPIPEAKFFCGAECATSHYEAA